ncbi:MAG: SocA family protein [Methanobrevibacter sp.]|jgi:uncharacterized phage-associated protein|nr:SocA family protein [Methanobrevibacter sp.]
MKLNKEKMKQVIHYIVHRCQDKPNFGKTVLYKLMYFSDFNHYEIYETSITDETYIKKRNGPTPDHFDVCCDELRNENKIDNEKVPVISYHRDRYFSLNEPNTSLLSKEELEVIDDVINNLSHMNASQISDYSHGDKPWRVAEFLQPLNPEFVFYRDDEYSVREYDD